MTFLQALGQCSPVIIMDEPQEGVDTDNAFANAYFTQFGTSGE